MARQLDNLLSESQLGLTTSLTQSDPNRVRDAGYPANIVGDDSPYFRRRNDTMSMYWETVLLSLRRLSSLEPEGRPSDSTNRCGVKPNYRTPWFEIKQRLSSNENINGSIGLGNALIDYIDEVRLPTDQTSSSNVGSDKLAKLESRIESLSGHLSEAGLTIQSLLQLNATLTGRVQHLEGLVKTIQGKGSSTTASPEPISPFSFLCDVDLDNIKDSASPHSYSIMVYITFKGSSLIPRRLTLSRGGEGALLPSDRVRVTISELSSTTSEITVNVSNSLGVPRLSHNFQGGPSTQVPSVLEVFSMSSSSFSLSSKTVQSLISEPVIVPSNSMIDMPTFEKILAAFKAKLPDAEKTTSGEEIFKTLIWPFILYLWKNGSSMQMNSVSQHGPVEEADKPMSKYRFDRFSTVVAQFTTYRQFAAFFAKLVWNHSLATGSISGLASKGRWPDNTKYAAFDFFFGVLSDDAYKPDKFSLLRIPSKEERVASEAAFCVKVSRATRAGGQSLVSFAEVTRGRGDPSQGALPMPTVQLIEG